jgi:RNA polymerase sigma factor (sigma-70 family)
MKTSTNKNIVKKATYGMSKGNALISKNFVSHVNKHPVLSHERIVKLFESYREGDNKARELIINSNLRLVINNAAKAAKYVGNEIPYEDLIQEGTIGLMKAVEKFDHTKGFKFGTYATWWVRQAISQLILQKRVIRTPAHVQNVKRKISKKIEEFKKEFGEDVDMEELYGSLDTSADIVKAAINTNKNIVSIDAEIAGAGSKASGNNTMTLGDIIADESEGSDPFQVLANKEMYLLVKKALKNLSPKELAILKLRFGNHIDDEDDGSYEIEDDE